MVKGTVGTKTGGVGTQVGVGHGVRRLHITICWFLIRLVIDRRRSPWFEHRASGGGTLGTGTLAHRARNEKADNREDSNTTDDNTNDATNGEAGAAALGRVGIGSGRAVDGFACHRNIARGACRRGVGDDFG